MAAHAPEAVIDLTLPSDPRYLALVRVVVGAAAAAIPSLSDARVADLKLVATELFANAMEANWRSARSRESVDASAERSGGRDRTPEDPCDEPRGRPDGAAPVQVMCRAHVDAVTLTVTDAGPGLDASDELHPPVEDPTRLQHERGLGIPLIQYLADKVDYVSDSDGTSATVVLTDSGDRRTIT